LGSSHLKGLIMPTNQYLAFAVGGGANTLPYSAYSALTAIIGQGFQPGVASSEQMNTVLRQTTVGVAALAQFAADNSGNNLLDDGNAATFAASILLAINTLIAAKSIPSGAVAAFARNTAPTGWLEANGATISRTGANAALFAAIGTTFGAGDGTTTFRIPDLRGYFVRGWDHGSGVDSGRAFGSTQADAFAAHTHGGVPLLLNDADRGVGNASAFSIDDVGVTASTGAAAETRPKNVALMYCIKL
jgi:hypothetical protein